jgi:hypothetical protein
MSKAIYRYKRKYLAILPITLIGCTTVTFATDNSSTPDIGDYTFCSKEHGQCSFTGTRIVRYGADNNYTYMVAENGAQCDNETFGDPIRGRTKNCYYSEEVDSSSVEYTHCADERNRCDFSGTRLIRYGAEGTYTYMVSTDGVSCSNDVFGDPLYGTVKACSYSADVKGRSLLHPGGALNTDDEFALMREKIAEEAEPWKSAWEALNGDTRSVLGRTPRPMSKLVRGGSGSNFGRIIRELQYMYAAALNWKITGDNRYAEQAINYLNEWSYALEEVSGSSDVYLAAGLYGYQFAITGEIMKSYDGWPEADRQQLKDMLLDYFYTPHTTGFLRDHNFTCPSHYWANWDLASIAGVMAIGIYADRPDLYQEALDYLYNGVGNGALRKLMYYRHAGNMGQYQESGRDQGHTAMGVSLYGIIAKMAWIQGDDLFSYNNYALLATSEYIARYNLGEDVPYVPYVNCSTAKYGQETISEASRGHFRASQAMIFNHYQNRLGIAAPWSEIAAEKVKPEVPGNGDEPGWGTLTEARDPVATDGVPKALTVIKNADNADLSWWGVPGADSYLVKRSPYKNGPFGVIAEVKATDLLTYTDKELDRYQPYYYQVTSLTDGMESGASNTVKMQAGWDLVKLLTFDDKSATGRVGNAIQLDGSEDYVTLEKGLINDVTDYTIGGWIYVDKHQTWSRFFDFGFNAHEYMTFITKTSYNQSCFIVTRDSGRFAEKKICADTIPEGKWTHVAVTLSGKTATLYINGEKVDSRDDVIMNPFQLQLGDSERLWLGRSQHSGDPLLAGKIDDFRIYNGAMVDEEVAALANPPE